MEEKLKSLGYKKQTFFYAIGGGEDESDEEIYVKNNVCIWYEYYSRKWLKCDYNKCTYVNGLDEDNAVIINFNDLNKF